MLIFFVSHEFFNSSCHSLYMIDNQFIKVSIRVGGIDDELSSNRLTGWVSVKLRYIYRTQMMPEKTESNKLTLPIC